MKGTLAKIVDPAGPLGEILSPSEIYKERAGLPVTAPYSARAAPHSVPIEEVRKMCAPVRHVVYGEEDAPRSRARAVTPYIVERWMPVYHTPENESTVELIRAATVIVAWHVMQEPRSPYCDCTSAVWSKEADGTMVHQVCGRARRAMSDREYIEHVQSIQVAAMSDFAYDGLYATLGHKKPADNVIAGGRREYRERTKGMILWDKGTQRDLDRVRAANAAAKQRAWDLRIEQYDKRSLPDRLGEI